MDHAIFHPWVREQALAAANQLRDALRQWPQTLFVLAAWALLGALVVFVARHVDGDRMGLVVEALVRRTAGAVLLATNGYTGKLGFLREALFPLHSHVFATERLTLAPR